MCRTPDRYAQYEGWSAYAHNITPDDIEEAFHLYLEKGSEKVHSTIYLTPENIFPRAVLWWKLYLHAPPGVYFHTVISSMMAHGLYELDAMWAVKPRFDFRICAELWGLLTRSDPKAINLQSLCNVLYHPASMRLTDMPLAEDVVFDPTFTPFDNLHRFLASFDTE